jgi:hypothetical protein
LRSAYCVVHRLFLVKTCAHTTGTPRVTAWVLDFRGVMQDFRGYETPDAGDFGEARGCVWRLETDSWTFRRTLGILPFAFCLQSLILDNTVSVCACGHQRLASPRRACKTAICHLNDANDTVLKLRFASQQVGRDSRSGQLLLFEVIIVELKIVLSLCCWTANCEFVAANFSTCSGIGLSEVM